MARAAGTAGRFRDAVAPRHDPTGTLPVARRFVADIVRRTARLKRLTREFVVGHDYLGLGAPTVGSIQLQASTAGKLDAFARWFGNAAMTVVYGNDGTWIAPYVDAAYRKGTRDAATRVRATMAPDQAKIDALVAADRHEVNGVVDATEQQVVRAVGEALARGKDAKAVMAAVVDRIDAIGATRLKALAHYAVVGAHAAASLAVYRASHVAEVGLVPERLQRRISARLRTDSAVADQREMVEVQTAEDDLVCDECENIADDGPYPLDLAEGLIPAHPNCRCVFVPTDTELRQASRRRVREALSAVLGIAGVALIVNALRGAKALDREERDRLIEIAGTPEAADLVQSMAERGVVTAADRRRLEALVGVAVAAAIIAAIEEDDEDVADEED